MPAQCIGDFFGGVFSLEKTCGCVAKSTYSIRDNDVWVSVSKWKGLIMARLILIEDEAGVQDYFRAVVSRLGHELLTASDGPSGIQLIEKEPVDVIMTDLNMPGEPSGMALVRKIREMRPDTPVIVVSGYPTKERINECSALGIDDFLTKPFEMTFFSSVVERLLEENQAK
jgi:CheY-like chemotaxis protein